MDDFSKEDPQSGEDRARNRRMNPSMWLLLLVLGGILIFSLLTQTNDGSEIDYSFLIKQIEAGNVEDLTLGTARVEGRFVEPPDVPESKDSQNKLINRLDP